MALVVLSFNLATASIISSQLMIESSIIFIKYLPFVQLHLAGCQVEPFSRTLSSFRFLHSHQHYRSSTFDLNYIFYQQIHIYMYICDIYFVNVLHSFIPVIIMNMLGFKSSVLFGTHTSKITY